MAASALNFNSRARIGVRIGAGYGLIALLLLISCGLAWRAIENADSLFAGYSRITRNALQGSEIEGNIGTVRRMALIYASSGDPQMITAIEKLDTEIRKQIIDAIAVSTSEARRSLMRVVQGRFAEYMQGFRRLIDLRNARTAAIDQGMNPLAEQIRGALATIIDVAIAKDDFETAAFVGVAQEELGTLRVNALRYLLKPDAALAAVSEARQIELTNALETAGKVATGEDLRWIRRAQELLPRYVTAFRQARDAITSMDELMSVISVQIAEQIVQDLATLKQSRLESLTETRKTVIEENAASEREFLIIGAAALFLTVLIAAFITRGITRPIAGMTGAMGAIANGNLAIEIPAQSNKDELGVMAKAVQVFKENAIRVAALEEEQRLAAARADAEKKQALEKLADGFEEQVGVVVATLSASTRQLQTAASSMSETAEATSQRAVAVAAASEEATTNVQTVATAAEELSASIGEISRQVANSSQIANQAVLDVAATGKSVEALAEAAQKIGDVVKLISDIASQTNLLALNATIEAARAGEAGKGFAVVASEVKNLASQTARATSEIGGQIMAIQTATGDSVVAMRAIGETIGKMNEIAAAIASAVEEQGAATQEIARNVQQAAAGTADVSLNITAVNAAANETGVAAGQVKAAASTMGAQAEDLSRAVDGFVSRVRAA